VDTLRKQNLSRDGYGPTAGLRGVVRRGPRATGTRVNRSHLSWMRFDSTGRSSTRKRLSFPRRPRESDFESITHDCIAALGHGAPTAFLDRSTYAPAVPSVAVVRREGPGVTAGIEVTATFVDTVSGIRLAYQSAGKGDPALVFVHGWCCNRSYFAAQVEHFAARHTTLSLDLRGHGDSDRPEPGPRIYSVEAFADDVLAVARAAGLDRPVIAGHSLGGLVALACAARAGSVRAAVLINPAFTLDGPTKAFFARSFEAISNDTNGAWRAAFAARIMMPTDRVRRAEILASVTATPAIIAAAAWRAIEQFDAESALGEVRVPLLAISSGGEEAGLPAHHRDKMTVRQTVGAGHFSQLEVPDQVNPMIERFLLTRGICNFGS
jgi:pimeloyl-ACP methyl ester carboxylesterase